MLGIDLVEIDRVARALKNDRFAERVFTERERRYADGKRTETFAGMFAAKEAAAKALGTGFQGIRHTDIEILHNDAGAPYLELHGRAAALAAGKRAQVSITHSRTSAAAVVLIGGAE